MKKKKLTEEKVFAYIREHHMLEPGDRVVAGISGGADSVCLLFVLLEWAKREPLELVVVHINHGIRTEAAEDAEYVERLCREHQVPFYLIQEDVRKKAEEEKCSEEEMGRKVRYEAFARIAQEFGANKIAVAHNSNDRSETMLFHLFRGSGIKGLCSIQPVRENIIRPILCLERVEIEGYLQERGIAYCQDATNSTDDYTRNRIRHHILPYVEEEIVQGCVRHMAQTAQMLSETEDYLEQQTAVAMEQCAYRKPGAARVSVQILLQYHQTIQKRVLHTLVKSLSPGQKDISYVHIQDLLGLFTGEGNRSVSLPFGICGRREYDFVYIESAPEEKKIEKILPQENLSKGIGEAISQGIFIELPNIELSNKELSNIEFPNRDYSKDVDLQEISRWEREVAVGEGTKLKFCILQNPQQSADFREGQQVFFAELPRNEYTKWFDYDKIKGCVEVRIRQTGDYLTIADGAGNQIHKSLKDYMIARKIPRIQRDRMPLVAEGNHVIWLPGYRISEYYKINKNTKCVLQVQLISKDFTEVETEEK